MAHTARMADEDTETILIDDVSYKSDFETIAVAEDNDIFKKPVKGTKLSKKSKSKYYRLEKKQPSGADGTESKIKDPEMINGYGMFDVVEPPYNLEVLASLFEENATHNACIMARTMNTVGLGYKWVDTSKSKKKVEKATAKDNENSITRVRDALQAEEDKLYDLFDSFNIDDSFTETLIKCWVDYLTVGNCYIEVGRNRNGSIGYIGHVPAVYLRVRRERDGFVQRVGNQWTFFRNFQDLDTKDPINDDSNPNEIIHIKAYTPTNTYYGVPSAVSAIAAIIGDKFAKEFNIDYFENKSIPRYAIILKGASLSPKSKQEIINYFKNEVKGNNHGTLLIPIPATMGKDVDLKFEALENKVQEGSFDKYRKSNRDEITIAHRVPGTKIGIFDNANLAVSRDADKTFKMQVVGPDQTVLEKKINRIVAEFSDAKKFKFDEIDLIDEDLRSRIHDRYLRTEVMAPNEVRQIIGITAREGGDEILPYPSKVQRDKNIDAAGLIPESYEGLDEKKIKVQPKPAFGGGGEVGNSNAENGSPPKGGQDAANKEGSPADTTTGRKERGEGQDQGGM